MNKEPVHKCGLDVSVEEVLILLNTFLSVRGVLFVSTAKPVLPMLRLDFKKKAMEGSDSGGGVLGNWPGSC